MFNRSDFIWWALFITALDLCWELFKVAAMSSWWLLKVIVGFCVSIVDGYTSKRSE